jgi:hypothetical protein
MMNKRKTCDHSLDIVVGDFAGNNGNSILGFYEIETVRKVEGTSDKIS